MLKNVGNWPAVSIDQLCVAIVDCVNRTAPIVDTPTPYRMIRTTNVRDGFIDVTDNRFVDENTFKRWTRRQLPLPGDVILTREAPLGEVGIVRPGPSIFLGQRLVSYRTDPNRLDPRYLLYYLRSDVGRAQVMALGSGATVAHMRVPDAKNLKVPVPPLADQNRIGHILGTYDDLIDVNRRRVALLEEMSRALFEEWFVRFRFPGHENVALVDTANGLLPSDWAWVRFDALVDEVRDAVSPAAVRPDTPYVGLEHIPRRSTTLNAFGIAADVGSTKLRFTRGDVLFGKIRPYFHKVAWAPFDGVASSDAIVFRPRACATAAVALCVASSDPFVAQSVQTSNGTKMPRANPTVLKSFKVAQGPPELTAQFARSVDPMIELAASLQAANHRLSSARDLLLPRLISGQLSVVQAELELARAA